MFIDKANISDLHLLFKNIILYIYIFNLNNTVIGAVCFLPHWIK